MQSSPNSPQISGYRNLMDVINEHAGNDQAAMTASITTFEQELANAAQNAAGGTGDFRTNIDLEKGVVRTAKLLDVVEIVSDHNHQIDLASAQDIVSGIQIGAKLATLVPTVIPDQLGGIATKTTTQFRQGSLRLATAS